VKCCKFEKLRHTWKNAPNLKKSAKLGKVRYTCRTLGTVGKMRRSWKNAQRLVKCTKLRKMRYTWKNAAHLEKCATFGKIGIT